MFCPKCGNQMADNAKFCGKCGYSVAPAAPAEEPVYAPPAYTPPAAPETPVYAAPVYTAPAAPAPKKKKKSGINWTVFIIMMLVGLLIIGGGVYFILCALDVIDSDLFDSSSNKSSSRDKDDEDEDEVELEFKLKGFKFEISDEIEWDDLEPDETSTKMEWEAEGMTLTVSYREDYASQDASVEDDIEYGEKNGVNYYIHTRDDDDIVVSASYAGNECRWVMTVNFTDEAVADEYMDIAIDMVTGGRIVNDPTSENNQNQGNDFPSSGSDDEEWGGDSEVVVETTAPVSGEMEEDEDWEDAYDARDDEDNVEAMEDWARYYFGPFYIDLPGDFEGYVEEEGDGEYFGEYQNDDFYLLLACGSMEDSPDEVTDSRSFAQWYYDGMSESGYDVEMDSRFGVYYVIVYDSNCVYGFRVEGDSAGYVVAAYNDEDDLDKAIDYAVSFEYGY